METFKRWGDVPSNLKSKTMLNKEGLKPTNKPVATVYQRSNNEYINLYNINDTIQKKVLSDKQKEALVKARSIMIENRTCKNCGIIKKHKSELINGFCYDCHSAALEEEARQHCIYEIINQRKYWLDNPDDFLILDVETTGLEYSDRIIEIAIINLKGQILLNTLLHTDMNISDGAFQTHSITKDMLISKPTMKDIYSKLINIIQGKSIIGFNVSFDKGMIINTISDYIGLDNSIIKSTKYFDLMQQEMTLINSKRYISLLNCVRGYGVGKIQEHRALGDTVLCKNIIEKSLEFYKDYIK